VASGASGSALAATQHLLRSGHVCAAGASASCAGELSSGKLAFSWPGLMTVASSWRSSGQVVYEAVIGIECHIQLNTRSKAFCGCPNEYGAPPNTHVCPVCLAHPVRCHSGVPAPAGLVAGRTASLKETCCK